MHLSNSAAMDSHMRLQFLLPALVVATAAAAAAAPPLAALKGFRPGAWAVKAVGGTSSSSQCLADPSELLTGGRAAQECSFSVIADGADAATVTYRCAAGRSGRTQLRRDAHGLYVVDAQGLENGHPFASRSEWRRTGDC